MSLKNKLLTCIGLVVVLAILGIFVVLLQAERNAQKTRPMDGVLEDYIVECWKTEEVYEETVEEDVVFTWFIFDCVAKSPDGSKVYELNLERGNATTASTASTDCQRNDQQLRVDVILDSTSFDYVALDRGYTCTDPVRKDELMDK